MAMETSTRAMLAALCALWLACGPGAERTSAVPTPPPPPARVAGEPMRVPPPARAGWREVAVGEAVSCGRTDDGSVHCWGSNDHGRAGLGTIASAALPTRVEGLPPIRAIAVGDRHGCALDEAGDVHCWGDNAHGQLGDGTTTSRGTPARVEGVHDVVELDASVSHTCARERDGDVRCWGRALHVGDGSSTDRLRPSRLGLRDVAEVVLGHAGGCAILADRTVRCWGFNGSGVFGARTGPFARPVPAIGEPPGSVRVRALALGDRHVCIQLEDGHLECAGSGEAGERLDLDAPDEAQCDEASGTVTCTWVAPERQDEHGMGSEPMPDRWPPPPRPEPPRHTRTVRARSGFVLARWEGDVVVVDGAYGLARTCVIHDGTVRCAGARHVADWAHRRATPIEGTLGAIQLDVATHHGCAVLQQSTLVCWGRNDAGELGDGTTTTRHHAAPVR